MAIGQNNKKIMWAVKERDGGVSIYKNKPYFDYHLQDMRGELVCYVPPDIGIGTPFDLTYLEPYGKDY